MYNCKFSRKAGYLPCPWQIKLSFMSDSPAVTVETIDGVEEHKHEVDPQHAANQGAVFKWTDEQTNVIEHDLKNGRYPNVIQRNLIKANVFGLRKPSKVQLYNKIAAVKKKLFPSHQILNTHQLRQKVSALLEVPDSEVEGFIPYWEIIDEKENEEPRFCVVFTTPRNQQKVGSHQLLQSDATYRLLWMGFPVFVLGTSSPTGRFFATCVVLASHEDTEGWASIYRYVSSLDNHPKYHLADGAKAITKAIDEVFDLETCTRLMCWPHVHRNIVPKLKSVSVLDKALANDILHDIENLQWSVLNEKSFRKVLSLLEKKHLDNQNPDLKVPLKVFFDYMRAIWVDSRGFRWYEGANPWGVSNNQGVEGKNKVL